MAEILEAAMVISFGVSWPTSIIKSYRARTAKGKSLLFLCFIFFGYVCGIAAKVISGSITGSEVMMARTIEAISAAGLRDGVRIILGGNCISERQALKIGADAYSRDLLDCVRLSRRFVLGEE